MGTAITTSAAAASSAAPLASSPHPELPRRRILVCLDRTASSEACVAQAVSMARTFGSSITLVHVLRPPRDAGPRTHDALGWEISRQEARGYLDRVEREVAQALGQPVEVRLEQGRPAERIIDLAREIGADITVIGGHADRSGSPRNLGSTAQQLIGSMHGSVLVAHRAHSGHAAAAAVATAETGPRRILVPLDGSQRTESVLPTAARLALAHGAELLLVHVVQEPIATALLHAAEGIDLAQTLASRLETAARRYLEQLQRQLALQGLTAHSVVGRHANTHQCLLEISQREQADLIVLSAHGSACDSARAFGSVTTYLLTYSPVPLLVLQDLPEVGAHRWPDADGRLDSRLAPPPLRAGSAAESM
jgi:nucleotide-binding universal stress UspA family protein